MSQMIEIRRLTKRFGPLTAIDDISFSVDRGEVLGFLGPNGAGKSTTMKVVTGFLPPTSGTVIVSGFDVTASAIEVKKRVGYLPEGAPLYDDMTPESFLSFVAEIRGFSGADKRTAVDRAADLINVSEVMQQPIGTLSKGFKRRVGLAQAILHDPEVLILDEPTDGLDPNQKHQVRDLIREMSVDKAIIISTHILEEVEAVCSRAVIIANGRLLVDGTPEDLLARSPDHNAVVLTVDAAQEDAVRKALKGLEAVKSIKKTKAEYDTVQLRIRPRKSSLIAVEVADVIRARKIPVHGMFVDRGGLDEVFRKITVDDKPGGEGDA